MSKLRLKNLLPLVLISLSLLFSSCLRESPLARNLPGNWEITSYLLNGEEQIGKNYQSIDYQFSTNREGKGTFSFEAIFNNGDSFNRKGNYELNDEGTEMSLMLPDSMNSRFPYMVDVDRKAINMTQFLGSAVHEFKGLRR